jgi:aspartate aminotransferase
MYSNPPIHGARLVEIVLGDPELRAEWAKECAGMANRIISMRQELRSNLEKLGSDWRWQHITDQIGMFAYSGMTKEQTQRLMKEFHVYCTEDGRISMAGITLHNVEYVAHSIHEVTK